jgi:hypothetical protein
MYNAGFLRQPLFQGKSNKYYIFRECVFVALGIQRAVRMRCLPSSIFFHFEVSHPRCVDIII